MMGHAHLNFASLNHGAMKLLSCAVRISTTCERYKTEPLHAKTKRTWRKNKIHKQTNPNQFVHTQPLIDIVLNKLLFFSFLWFRSNTFQIGAVFSPLTRFVIISHQFRFTSFPNARHVICIRFII